MQASDVEVSVEYDLVQQQRGVEEERVYHTKRYQKRDVEHARKGLADWEENKARVLESGAVYIVSWTAHIETRIVTETPWERLET